MSRSYDIHPRWEKYDDNDDVASEQVRIVN